MASVPSGLVWLASFPKSGNTWLRVLLSNLLAGERAPVHINRLSGMEAVAGKWTFTDETLVDPSLLAFDEVERLRPVQCDFRAAALTEPQFWKTHDRFAGLSGTPVLGAGARLALYLVRDPRDVAVSLAHHMGTSLDEAVAMIGDNGLRFGGGMQLRYLVGDWGGHVTGWTDQSVVPLTLLRYEDLHRDTEACMTRIVTALDATATPEEIRQAVEHSSLAELQRQEAAAGFRESTPRQDRFFRSGRVGEWRDILTRDQIRTIETRFAPVMERLGYPVGG